ncbi:hypothetical protein GMRT_10858 [Giardia muris]|uniref:Uncharacterized protein n=1 Tax=Giardia muris TaxID=5742 RepID=A0A4Z1SP02_GIAMU|nr:hypothetical protein GMRT_10858 [Giardia muris]|eukprot:TNJ27554.1 hypothetical protein GMRT_10858 [Giardia muris]
MQGSTRRANPGLEPQALPHPVKSVSLVTAQRQGSFLLASTGAAAPMGTPIQPRQPSSGVAPVVHSLEEALATCLEPSLRQELQKSVLNVPKLYSTFKAQFDLLAKTLLANVNTIPEMPLYCRVAASFKRRGVIKVVQQLMLDGHIPYAAPSAYNWAPVKGDQFSILPIPYDRLLRPGLLSRIVTSSQLQEENASILESVSWHSILEASQTTRKNEGEGGALRIESLIGSAMTVPAIGKVKVKQTRSLSNPISGEGDLLSNAMGGLKGLEEQLQLEEGWLYKQFFNGKGKGTKSSKPDHNMDQTPMQPFLPLSYVFTSSESSEKDEVSQEDDLKTPIRTLHANSVLTAPLAHVESQLSFFYTEILGIVPIREPKERSSAQPPKPTSSTEISLTSSPSDPQLSLPCFNGFIHFKKYPSVKNYREFLRDLVITLSKAMGHSHRQTGLINNEVLLDLREKVKCPTILKHARRYLTEGPKGRAFQRVQPHVEVGKALYINRASLLRFIDSYTNTPIMSELLKLFYVGYTASAYLQLLIGALLDPFEEAELLSIHPLRYNVSPLKEDYYIGTSFLKIRVKRGGRELIIPFIPNGFSDTGMHVLTEVPPTSTFYPGETIRVPVASYSPAAKGVILHLEQAIVLSTNSTSLIAILMEVVDVATDQPVVRDFPLLKQPKAHEDLACSSDLCTLNTWDVYRCENCESGVMLPYKLLGQCIQHPTRQYMSDAIYNKRLKKTRMFASLDVSENQVIGRSFFFKHIESMRDILKRCKFTDASNVVLCENSLSLIAALLINPSIVALLEYDATVKKPGLMALATNTDALTSFKVMTDMVWTTLRTYDASFTLPGTAQRRSLDAIKVFYNDLLVLLGP